MFKVRMVPPGSNKEIGKWLSVEDITNAGLFNILELTHKFDFLNHSFCKNINSVIALGLFDKIEL